jgi:hypothetical protein
MNSRREQASVRPAHCAVTALPGRTTRCGEVSCCFSSPIVIYHRGAEIARHPRLIGQRDARHTLPGHHPTPGRASRGPAQRSLAYRPHACALTGSIILSRAGSVLTSVEGLARSPWQGWQRLLVWTSGPLPRHNIRLCGAWRSSSPLLGVCVSNGQTHGPYPTSRALPHVEDPTPVEPTLAAARRSELGR